MTSLAAQTVTKKQQTNKQVDTQRCCEYFKVLYYKATSRCIYSGTPASCRKHYRWLFKGELCSVIMNRDCCNGRFVAAEHLLKRLLKASAVLHVRGYSHEDQETMNAVNQLQTCEKVFIVFLYHCHLYLTENHFFTSQVVCRCDLTLCSQVYRSLTLASTTQTAKYFSQSGSRALWRTTALTHLFGTADR